MDKRAGFKSDNVFISYFKEECDFHYKLLLSFFDYDKEKVCQWLTTKNPLLGYAEPLAIYIYKKEKLIRFIESALSENELEEK